MLFQHRKIQQNKYQPIWEFLKLSIKSFLFPQITRALIYGHDTIISPSFRGEDTEMETQGGGTRGNPSRLKSKQITFLHINKAPD